MKLKIKKLFKMAGGLYLGDIIRLSGVEDLDEVERELEELMEEGFIEKNTTSSGIHLYRIPKVGEEVRRTKPLEVRRPVRFEDVSQVIQKMEEIGGEFTVNMVVRAFKDQGEKFSSDKMKNIFAHLIEDGMIEVAKTRKYMGRVYDLYHLKDEGYPEAWKVVLKLREFSLQEFLNGYNHDDEEESKKVLKYFLDRKALFEVGRGHYQLEDWVSKHRMAEVLEVSRRKVNQMIESGELIEDEKSGRVKRK